LDLETTTMKSKPADPHSRISVDLSSLAEIVERFSTKTVVLFGDFVADEFQYGEITRVSREAPVLILRHRETLLVPGGGANAANNLASLGARVFPATIVGEDEAGDALIRHFRERHQDVSGIVRARGWKTPTKTRFLAGWAHTVAHQVLRVDREPEMPPPESARKLLLTRFAARVKTADALAISDYGFGTVDRDSVRSALARLRKKTPVTMDARRDLHGYAKLGITAATPNEAELEALHHTTIGRNTAELERCGSETLKSIRLGALLVTRGRDGMALFVRGQRHANHIPVHGSNQAVDVTGAGDTVLAAFTLALACGASFLEAAHIANIAGGLVVMKRGTATVSLAELLDAIQKDISGAGS
jgi:rfaE bifunctional protein kinase chain/domain